MFTATSLNVSKENMKSVAQYYHDYSLYIYNKSKGVTVYICQANSGLNICSRIQLTYFQKKETWDSYVSFFFVIYDVMQVN